MRSLASSLRGGGTDNESIKQPGAADRVHTSNYEERQTLAFALLGAENAI